jgi:hypothetical protein
MSVYVTCNGELYKMPLATWKEVLQQADREEKTPITVLQERKIPPWALVEDITGMRVGEAKFLLEEMRKKKRGGVL